MPECKKCGYKTSEEMSFCPKCGAPLKAEQVPTERQPTTVTRQRDEKAEKFEKHEKGEKHEKKEKPEKHEKGEYAYLGPLIGGIILIIIGLTSFFTITGLIDLQTRQMLGALFVIAIGVAIIFGALYFLTVMKRRNPAP